jgi:hypothetical protein
MRCAALGALLSAALMATPACRGAISDIGESEGSRAPGGPSGGGNGAGASGAGTFVASESVARRLSQAELDNTVRDVFGDESHPATRFLSEEEYAPYDNDYTLQQASKTLIESLDALAEDVATRLMADAAVRAKLVPCTPSGPGDADCFREVVSSLGRLAFRRPLDATEVDSYLPLLDFATEDNPYVDNDFNTAVGLFLRAVLQDPEFLYRIEVGAPTGSDGVFALSSYEIATRVSFLLWGSAPDDALLSRAESGELTDPQARRAEATRLLGDPRARQQVQRFHAMWLGYRAIPHPADLVSAFNDETSHLIDRVVFDERRSYLDLFTMGETHVDDFLADHYGLPRPTGGAGWVSYGDTERAGILSHASVLAAFSKFSDTSPTQRGILVRTRLLCLPIQRPPANVNTDQPPGDEDAECKVDRYAAHRQIESCANCHDQMDPIGFGLEAYDVAGRFRTNDDGKPECAIEGRGELPGVGPFSGPGELGALLVDSGDLEACAVQQLFTWLLGRSPDSPEVAHLQDVVTDFQESGYDFEQVLESYVASEAFGLRKEPEVMP